MDIKITKDCYLPKESVKFYVSYSLNWVKEDVRKKRKTGICYDFTNHKRISSVIYLNSGELILVNTSIDTLESRMNADKPGIKKA